MKIIDEYLADVFVPQKALLVYRHLSDDSKGVYVEAYDMDAAGCPVNAHPLGIEEGAALSRALDCSEAQRKGYLKSAGLLPENVLHIDPARGFVLWHTPPMDADLLFKKGLTIPCGKAAVPALLWKADRHALSLYALKSTGRPTRDTPLYHAPFFNIYADGKVCMGTVDVDIDRHACLEDFIGRRQHYFFGSYFSHLIGGHNAVKGNIVQLWQGLTGSGRPFPVEVLTPSPLTCKDLIR